MALVRCYECNETISDKAQCCPYCGAPIANLDNQYNQSINNAYYINSNCSYKKRKSSLTYFFTAFFATIFLAVIIIAFVLDAGKGNKSYVNSKDPNRTKESCSYLGEASVLPSNHNGSEFCSPDGDGYWQPAMGHHHHKQY